MIVEYHDVIERSRRRPGIEFTLSTDLKNYIYKLTNSHPGVIDEMVIYVKCKCKRLFGADAGKHKCRTPGFSLIYLLYCCSFALWEWHPVAINDQMAKVVESRSSQRQ